MTLCVHRKRFLYMLFTQFAEKRDKSAKKLKLRLSMSAFSFIIRTACDDAGPDPTDQQGTGNGKNEYCADYQHNQHRHGADSVFGHGVYDLRYKHRYRSENIKQSSYICNFRKHIIFHIRFEAQYVSPPYDQLPKDFSTKKQFNQHRREKVQRQSKKIAAGIILLYLIVSALLCQSSRHFQA